MIKSKALLIEDDEMIRLLFRTVLSSHDLDVIEAGDGEEGMELLETETPDVVITDVSMPKADGFAVLRRARQVSPCTPVIMVSGSWLEEQEEEAQKLGAARTVNKPVDPGEFWRIVEEVMKEDRGCPRPGLN